MKRLFYLFCMVTLSSCVSLKQTQQTGIKKITDLSAFNGTFENLVDSNLYSSLWSQLQLGDTDSSNSKSAKVQFSAINNKQIKAVLTLNEKPISTLILKGKLKNNYFVSNSKRTIIPIPFIYGDFKNNQFQLAISENNNHLLVDRLNNQWGWFFVFLASNDQTTKLKYESLQK